VQVSVVTLTDLLPNLWLQALSINNNTLRQCIPCRGDDSRTSVADKYQTLPTQTICSVQRAMKIMTIIVSILIIIPTEPRWPARDTGAQKRSMLCNNIFTRNIVSCRHLLRFQCKWNLRSGCQGRKVKVYVIRTKHNPTCVLRDLKLWVVEFQSSFRQMLRLLITWFVDIVLTHAKYKQHKDCKW
jgi:hypothetical protein